MRRFQGTKKKKPVGGGLVESALDPIDAVAQAMGVQEESEEHVFTGKKRGKIPLYNKTRTVVITSKMVRIKKKNEVRMEVDLLRSERLSFNDKDGQVTIKGEKTYKIRMDKTQYKALKTLIEKKSKQDHSMPSPSKEKENTQLAVANRLELDIPDITNQEVNQLVNAGSSERKQWTLTQLTDEHAFLESTIEFTLVLNEEIISWKLFMEVNEEPIRQGRQHQGRQSIEYIPSDDEVVESGHLITCPDKRVVNSESNATEKHGYDVQPENDNATKSNNNVVRPDDVISKNEDEVVKCDENATRHYDKVMEPVDNVVQLPDKVLTPEYNATQFQDFSVEHEDYVTPDNKFIEPFDNATQIDDKFVKPEENVRIHDENILKQEDKAIQLDNKVMESFDNSTQLNDKFVKSEDNATKHVKSFVKQEKNTTEPENKSVKAESNTTKPNRNVMETEDNASETDQKDVCSEFDGEHCEIQSLDDPVHYGAEPLDNVKKSIVNGKKPFSQSNNGKKEPKEQKPAKTKRKTFLRDAFKAKFRKCKDMLFKKQNENPNKTEKIVEGGKTFRENERSSTSNAQDLEIPHDNVTFGTLKTHKNERNLKEEPATGRGAETHLKEVLVDFDGDTLEGQTSDESFENTEEFIQPGYGESLREDTKRVEDETKWTKERNVTDNEMCESDRCCSGKKKTKAFQRKIAFVKNLIKKNIRAAGNLCMSVLKQGSEILKKITAKTVKHPLKHTYETVAEHSKREANIQTSGHKKEKPIETQRSQIISATGNGRGNPRLNNAFWACTFYLLIKPASAEVSTPEAIYNNWFVYLVGPAILALVAWRGEECIRPLLELLVEQLRRIYINGGSFAVWVQVPNDGIRLAPAIVVLPPPAQPFIRAVEEDAVPTENNQVLVTSRS